MTGPEPILAVAPPRISSAPGWRARAKAELERLAVWSGATKLALRRQHRILVLAYHNIVPAGERAAGDRSLHLPQAAFGAQLDALSRTHQVVGLEEVFSLALDARPRAVITFDDAYRGALAAGVEELARRSLPATVFVPPAFVGGRTFWWDALAPEPPATLAEDVRQHLLDELRGDDDAVRAWAAAQGLPLAKLPDHARCVTLEELRSAARYDGLSLGSHSWSHRNLSRLEEDPLRDELGRSLKWLRDGFDRVVPWLACPYGLSSPSVERLAAATGYVGALRVSGGSVGGRPPRPFAVPRCNVPSGMSLHGFMLRTSGLLNG